MDAVFGICQTDGDSLLADDVPGPKSTGLNGGERLGATRDGCNVQKGVLVGRPLGLAVVSPTESNAHDADTRGRQRRAGASGASGNGVVICAVCLCCHGQDGGSGPDIPRDDDNGAGARVRGSVARLFVDVIEVQVLCNPVPVV